MPTVRLNKADASVADIRQIEELRASIDGQLGIICKNLINSSVSKLLNYNSVSLPTEFCIGTTVTYTNVLSKMHRIADKWAKLRIPFLQNVNATLNNQHDRVGIQKGTLSDAKYLEILSKVGILVDANENGVLVHFLLLVPSSEDGAEKIQVLRRYLRFIIRQALIEDLPLALQLKLAKMDRKALVETIDTMGDTDQQKEEALKNVVCYLCTLTFGVQNRNPDRYKYVLGEQVPVLKELPDVLVKGDIGAKMLPSTAIFTALNGPEFSAKEVFSEEIEPRIIVPVENLLYIQELFKIVKTLSRIAYNGTLPTIYLPSTDQLVE